MKRKFLYIFAVCSVILTNSSYADSKVDINDINNTVKANENIEIENNNKKIENEFEKKENLNIVEEENKNEEKADSKNNKVDVFSGVENFNYAVRLNIQSKEELKSLYDRGFRVFEITVSATEDNHIVLADNFAEYFYKYYGVNIKRPTIDEYFSYKMSNGNTQMSMGDINIFLNDYPDARFFVKSLDTEKNVFEILNNKSFKNKDKLIVEVTDILGNYKSFDNIAILDLKGDLQIFSFAANNKQKNLIFLYQNTSPDMKEIEEIKKSKQRLYEINRPSLNYESKHHDGYIYAIEDILNVAVKIPKPIKSNSYIAPIIKNDRFIAHAGGRVTGIVGTNTLQAMNSSYSRGNRILEIDFDWTTDGKIVQVHDWATFKKLSGDITADSYYMRYDEFKNKNMIYNLEQMSIDDTIKWLMANKDAYIVTDVKENNMLNGNIKALTFFSQHGKDIQTRLIPQIYDTSQYQKVKEMGYNNIIYTLYRTEQSPYGVLEFAKSNDLFAVTMDNIYRVHTKLPELLTNNGIRVYIHTENDKINARNYIASQKAYGIYSDDILTLNELNS